jgi:hypothetical protein
VEKLLALFIAQAQEMTSDMTAWVPYSFGPLYSFHLPPAAQALMAVGGEAVVHALAGTLSYCELHKNRPIADSKSLWAGAICRNTPENERKSRNIWTIIMQFAFQCDILQDMLRASIL